MPNMEFRTIRNTFSCSLILNSTLILFFSLFIVFLGTISNTYAQPACDYLIDANGDGIAEGTLYRDTIWSESEITSLYHDRTGGLGSIEYSKNAELYNGDLIDLRMDVFVPPATDTLAARDRPVIFFFYGGGYETGTSLRVENICLQYARRGYVTVAPNYRLGIKGLMPGDTTNVCEDLLEPAYTIYRAMLDAEAAFRWMMDSSEVVLGVEIDTTNLFLWGPGYFPLLSHMQSDEVPGALASLGKLQNIALKATVGRSAAMNLMPVFIDEDDKTPFLIFHGTCDKSVPFNRTTMYERLECDTVLPVSATINYPIYGSSHIVRAVDHYFEYYPICGLNHSHKDIEQNEMKEPIAEFLYNMVCNNIDVDDPPYYFPWSVQSPCNISGKCESEDNYNFCSIATPYGEACASDSLTTLTETRTVFKNGVSLFPNPNIGQFTITYSADSERDIEVRIIDFLGRVKHKELLQTVLGLNMESISIPRLESGSYFISVDGKKGPTLVIQK
ncbi:MAG: hypothetical protein ACI959_000653 [Limisphaerales bacterium]|jgi:hypothetical protein